jgi:ATPase, P-type (transporting), HAD superfamily, subfamily IC
VPGYGLKASATFQNSEKNVYIGRPSYIAEQLPKPLQKSLADRIREVEQNGELLAAMLLGDQLFLFRFRDTPRPKIGEMLQAVKARGKRTVMLTGDHVFSAQRIATELGISEFHADLTPADKLNYVTELAESKGLAMIGDGVNDAPALARATVGICMGKVGSTAAIDAADVILLHDNIELLDWLFAKAKQTQTVVKQNLFMAAGAILIASLPALAGLVPLWLAVVMHEGGTVLVGLNALRLLRS